MAANLPIVQKVVVGSIVVNSENKVLLMQRHDNEDVYPGLWELPSGKKEPLEPTLTALLRETKEEAGIDVEVIAPVSVFDYQIEKPDQIRDSVQINFLTRILPGQEVNLSSEHQKIAWVSQSELSDYPVTDSVSSAVKQAFSLLPKLSK